MKESDSDLTVPFNPKGFTAKIKIDKISHFDDTLKQLHKTDIKYCPNCANKLSDNPKLAQGVKECKSCQTRFYILITSSFS